MVQGVVTKPNQFLRARLQVLFGQPGENSLRDGAPLPVAEINFTLGIID
jgi:hypothetical protein